MKRRLSDSETKDLLEELVLRYNNPSFIEQDPISVPHQYSLKEDIEIAAFLTSTISWGKREIIVRNGHKMLDLLGESPYGFVMSYNNNQLRYLDKFVHRTFNGSDFKYFVKALRHIYKVHGGIEQVFMKYSEPNSIQPAIHHFKRLFFELPHNTRIEKHIGDPFKGSAAKKTNMLLRWLVRRDNKGVDFGLWKNINPAILSCPLDVHSGRKAREFYLLDRKQNDSKAVILLDKKLRMFDKNDPAKYDFALFGLGISEEFSY